MKDTKHLSSHGVKCFALNLKSAYYKTPSTRKRSPPKKKDTQLKTAHLPQWSTQTPYYPLGSPYPQQQTPYQTPNFTNPPPMANEPNIYRKIPSNRRQYPIYNPILTPEHLIYGKQTDERKQEIPPAIRDLLKDLHRYV